MVSVLLSALVKRFSLSRTQNFFIANITFNTCRFDKHYQNKQLPLWQGGRVVPWCVMKRINIYIEVMLQLLHVKEAGGWKIIWRHSIQKKPCALGLLNCSDLTVKHYNDHHSLLTHTDPDIQGSAVQCSAVQCSAVQCSVSLGVMAPERVSPQLPIIQIISIRLLEAKTGDNSDLAQSTVFCLQFAVCVINKSEIH